MPRIQINSVASIDSEKKFQLPPGTESEQKQWISRQIYETLKEITDTSSDMAQILKKPFMNLGLDSLVSIEFRQAIGKRFDLRLSNTFLFDFPTILSATEYVFGLLKQQQTTNKATDYLFSHQIVDSDRVVDTDVHCFTITRPDIGSVCFPQALSRSVIETITNDIESFVKIDENGVNLISDSIESGVGASDRAMSVVKALKGPAIVVMFRTCPGYDSTMIDNLKRASAENGLTLVRLESNGDTTYLVNF